MRKSISVIAALFAMMAGNIYAASLGEVSQNLLGPATGIGHLMNAICYLVGLGFLLTGLLQYKYHRENPQQVKLSTPISLLLIGLAMLALPFLSMMSTSSGFLK